MSTLVVTVVGPDRPGLVADVSVRISEHGGSWVRSQLTHLAGRFAGVVEVRVPAGRFEDLETALHALGDGSLRIGVERPEPTDGAEPQQTWTLELMGADRPGIVAEITSVLACHEVNVEAMRTWLSDAPMAGGRLFEAEAELAAPPDADPVVVSAALEAMADRLMVDLDLRVEGETVSDEAE